MKKRMSDFHFSFDEEGEGIFAGFGSFETAEPEDYLSRQERITTLAREKFTKEVRKISLSDAEQKLFEYVPQGDTLYEVAHGIAQKVIRPILRSMESVTDEYATMLLSLVELSGLKVSFTESVGNIVAADVKGYLRKVYGPSDVVLGLKIEEEGFEPYIAYGLKNATHPASYRNMVWEHIGLPGDFMLADLADLLGYLTVYSQVTKVLLQIAEGEDVAYGRKLVECQAEYNTEFANTYVFLDGDNAPAGKISFEEFLQLPIHISPRAKLSPMLERFITCHISRLYFGSKQVMMNHLANGEIKEGYFAALRTEDAWKYFLSCFLLREPLSFNSLRADRGKKGMVTFAMPAFAKSHKCYWEPFFCTLYGRFYHVIAEEKQKTVSYLDSIHELSDSTYAKSFMNKKLTVKKVLKAMADSTLNKYFGFVEYDEDVDLGKAKEIEAEISAVLDKYFPMVNSEENIIRFRKLGQRKALGVYFPYYACLCVDIRSPESFIHEYGHLIDFTYGGLSGKRAFYDIAEQYRGLFWKQYELLDADNPMKKQLGGRTKYNTSFYLNQREIFARCFEVWVVKCLGVKNSIVPEAGSLEPIIYPQDEVSLEMLDIYFKEMFKNIEASSTDKATA